MSASPHPYGQLPPKAFWRSAVAERGLFDLETVWTPRYRLAPSDTVATFGSCFAQHIGRALRERGYRWYDAEPAPEMLLPAHARRFNYGIFSARTGNIYTTSLLLQWVRWATGVGTRPKEIWEADGRFYDAFRPTIEPGGFTSRTEALLSRWRTLRALRDCIAKARVLVFTLGLTESWINAPHKFEYPLCPGTAAGVFDRRRHRFVNQDHATVLENLDQAITLMREVNPKLRFILTVSPVPLVATATGEHVLVATMAAKAVLRAAVARIVADRPEVDYFPSYELIASPIARGIFFDANGRGVARQGADFAMGHFFRAIEGDDGSVPRAAAPEVAPDPVESRSDVVCEEELLEAFGQ